MSFQDAIKALGGEKYAGGILSACAKFGIDSPLRQAHFLAQIAHESGRFKYVREIWGPTPQQLKYDPPHELAKKLGNTNPGDGFLYRGRGFIQITGKFNYYRVSNALFGNPQVLLDSPSLLERDPALSAGWYWQSHLINRHADADDVKSVTLAINGGLNGLADRKANLDTAKKAMGL